MSRPAPGLALASLTVLIALVIPAVQHSPSRAEAEPESPRPIVVRAAHFAVSPPIVELPAEGEMEGSSVEEEEPRHEYRFPTVDAGAGSIDAALQPSPEHAVTGAQETALTGPLVSFDGPSSVDNVALYSRETIAPPDTNGDVGPNHYVSLVNLHYRVYDKSGTPLITPRKLSSIFSALGGACATVNHGDPIVLYDALADRWLLSQICFVADPNTHQLIAISKTGDPTGAFYLYDFPMPNNKLNDYPKFGVWPDGYYMSDNQFLDITSGPLLGAGAFAFDRARMLSGDPAASYIYFDLGLAGGSIWGLLPSDLDGLNPPPPGTPNYFAYLTADEYGAAAGDALRIFSFHADFASPVLSTFTERAESPIRVPAFDPRSPDGRNDIEQPPPATVRSALDSWQYFLMFRLAYRNHGAEEGLVMTHTVNIGSFPASQAGHRSAIRYYQLRRALPAGAFTILDRATFAPDTDNRWMGSAAEDNQGNLAIGYSVSSTTTYPSVRYAGRLATDPPNGLFQGEQSIIAGSGVQTHLSGRWGDYSSLSVDPVDDCTFWYAQEYYSAASQASSAAGLGWLTRVASFKFNSCTPPAKGTIQGTAANARTHLPISGALIQSHVGHVRVTGTAGDYAMAVAPGTLDMTASAPGYLPSNAAGVLATDGITTTQDFALTPIPIMQSAGASQATGESCSPATGRLDPGETVTVELVVHNTGAGDTVDLTGTLLSSGGVLSPGPPQSYGVVSAGGEPVARSFTFMVDPELGCGGTLTASLQLQDRDSQLGTLTYVFPLGDLSNGRFTGTYGSGDLGLSIPDLSPIDIPFVVAEDGIIQDVNVRLRLNHSYDSDLTITLIHPDGTFITLANRRGENNADFGTGPNDCSGTPTLFDDSATTAISAGAAPFTGSFRPESPLSAFNGKQVAGMWRLHIYDQVLGAGLGGIGTFGCAQIEIVRRLQLCCPFATGAATLNAAPPATIITEGCSPAQGAADPGETVSASFPLQNFGANATTDLVATLLPGGGVTLPGPPQSYGSLPPTGPPVSREFRFMAQGACGASITPTVHLQDGPNDLGNVSFALNLGGYLPGPWENFDGVEAPALPAGWTATVLGASPPAGWATTTQSGFFASPPNAVATGGSESVSESLLDFAVAVPPGVTAQLSFRHTHALQGFFDGGVLEISISGSPFQDILAAGGSFVTGGYNSTISASSSSPIAGRLAWTGTVAIRLTTVNLPASAPGNPIILRWRAAFDGAISAAESGWRIDDVALSIYQCCGPAVVAALPATITDESCAPANGAADPDETLTISLPVRGVGTAATTHLVGTLLAEGGILAPDGPQIYGVVNPGAAPVARSFTFVPRGACGDSITPTLHMQDGSTDLGNLTYAMQLGPVTPVTTPFADERTIFIPTSGVATPYPSSIVVSGVPGTISKVAVTLKALSHTLPDDLDLLLVSPGGEKLIIMSDAGGASDFVGTTITLDDSAIYPLSDNGANPSGTYRPGNFGTGSDTFPALAPAGPYPSPAPAGAATFASVFNGTNPNGTWSLYVTDDFINEGGNIGAGWRLDITTSQPVCCSQACGLTCPADIIKSNDAGQCGANVDFDFGVSGSCGAVAGQPASGSFFPVGTTAVPATATSASGQVVGSCTFQVTVNDAEAPHLEASLSPDILWPPNHRMVEVNAGVTASDNCGPAGVILSSVTSNELDDANGIGDGNTDADIQNVSLGAFDLSFDLRAERAGTGRGRLYTATYTAADLQGNTAFARPTAFVAKDRSEGDDPLSLTLIESAQGTAVNWSPVSGVLSYSVIRGLISNLRDEAEFVNLGAVTCMAASTRSTSLIQRDTAVPAVGEVFFYAAAFNNGNSSSYGTATAAKPRVTASGGCE